MSRHLPPKVPNLTVTPSNWPADADPAPAAMPTMQTRPMVAANCLSVDMDFYSPVGRCHMALGQSAPPTWTNLSRPMAHCESHTSVNDRMVTIEEMARMEGSKSNSMELKTSTGNVTIRLPARNTDIGTSANEIMKA